MRWMRRARVGRLACLGALERMAVGHDLGFGGVVFFDEDGYGGILVW